MYGQTYGHVCSGSTGVRHHRVGVVCQVNGNFLKLFTSRIPFSTIVLYCFKSDVDLEGRDASDRVDRSSGAVERQLRMEQKPCRVFLLDGLWFWADQCTVLGPTGPKLGERPGNVFVWHTHAQSSVSVNGRLRKKIIVIEHAPS